MCVFAHENVGHLEVRQTWMLNKSVNPSSHKGIHCTYA